MSAHQHPIPPCEALPEHIALGSARKSTDALAPAITAAIEVA